jgi:hypothetical protein
MSTPSQSFENHARFVFMYHRVLLGMLLALLIWAVARAVGDFSVDRLFMLILVIAMVMIGLFARIFATGVQDRVIRLEERLRMAALFPEDLAGRLGELTTRQLISLRFASDAELEGLTRRVLGGELTDPKEIKRAITSWRADHQRI